MLKLRVGAGDGDDVVWKDKAVADTYGNRFYIPLDLELLKSHMPYYQNALGEHLGYELNMNAYNRVTKAGAEAKYSIQDISLEYDKVTGPGLARMIRNQYTGKLVIPYDHVVRHAMGMWDKKDPQWEVKFNSPVISLKGVLIRRGSPHLNLCSGAT